MSRYRQPYSLYKRGDYWYYRTYNSDGVRTSGKTTGQTSKNAAKEYCNNLYLKGELWKSEKTIYEYSKNFLKPDSFFIKDRAIPYSKGTLHGYHRFLDIIIEEAGNIKLSDINYTWLKKFRKKLLDRDLSPSSVTSCMTFFKKIITYAYRDGLILRNPFDMLEPLQNVSKRRDAFTLEEVQFIVTNIDDEFKNFIRLMALTGMRISEATGVVKDNLITENGNLFINLEKQMLKGQYEVLKNKQSRKIPVIPEIVELFGLDPTRTSKLYREFVNLEKQCKNYEERKLCIHSIRHFFITNSKSKGVNPLKVEVIAGHSLKGIQGVYTNFSPSDLIDIYSWQKETLELLR